MSEPAPALPTPLQLTPAERDAAIVRLSAAFAEDVIDVEEFERRAAAVFHAASAAELAGLVADLPEAGMGGPPVVLAPRPLLARVTALVGGVERGGALEVPEVLHIRAFFGDVQLDLSRSHFSAPVTTIAIFAVGSRVALRLPAGAVIENRGSGTLASFACRAGAPRVDGQTEAPRVHVLVTGRALFGSVEIETASRAWVLATRPLE